MVFRCRQALAPDTTNRPPAGEWQRALSQLLADARPYVCQYYHPSGSTGRGTPVSSSPGTPLGAGQGTQFR